MGTLIKKRFNLKKMLLALWQDESAQSTTEYIVMLAIVIAIALKFKTALSDMINKATTSLQGNLTSAIATDGS